MLIGHGQLLSESADKSLLTLSLFSEVRRFDSVPAFHGVCLVLLTMFFIDSVNLAVNCVVILHLNELRIFGQRQVEKIFTHDVIIFSMVQSCNGVLAGGKKCNTFVKVDVLSSRSTLSIVLKLLLDFSLETFDVLLHTTGKAVLVRAYQVVFPLSQLNEFVPDFLKFVDSLVVFGLNWVLVHS